MQSGGAILRLRLLLQHPLVLHQVLAQHQVPLVRVHLHQALVPVLQLLQQSLPQHLPALLVQVLALLPLVLVQRQVRLAQQVLHLVQQVVRQVRQVQQVQPKEL